MWILVIVLAEGVLFHAGFGPHAVRPPARMDKYRPDEQLIWTLKPSWVGVEPNGAVVRINSLGLRGPELARNPRWRIVMVGDSVTYGHYLEQEATVPYRLELELTRGRKAPIEVVNAGVPGWSTFQYATFVRREGSRLEPDLVVMGFCLNDVTERYSTVLAYGGPRFIMGNVDTGAGLGRWRRAWRSSAIRDALLTLLRRSARRGEMYRIDKLWAEPDSPHIRAAWELVFNEVDDLHAAASDLGADLAVVLFPYAAQIVAKPVHDGPQRRLRAELERMQIPYLDLLPGLRLSGQPAAALFLDDNHLTARGAEEVAQQLARYLRGGGHVPAEGDIEAGG